MYLHECQGRLLLFDLWRNLRLSIDIDRSEVGGWALQCRMSPSCVVRNGILHTSPAQTCYPRHSIQLLSRCTSSGVPACGRSKRRLWNNPTSLLALTCARRLRRMSFTKANSMLALLHALALRTLTQLLELFLDLPRQQGPRGN